MSAPRATVIISTYNRPAVLDLVLRGFARQSRLDFEVVVADDGSTGETAAVVEAFRDRAPFPVSHLWQEDRGFRKTTILNSAVRASTADYLVF